jgi:hypothetical protein
MTYHAGLGKAGGGGGGSGDTVAAVANATAATMNAASTFANIASGGPQKQERASRRALEAARLQAQATTQGAASAVEAARIQAAAASEAAREAAKGREGTIKLALISGSVLAVLGIAAVVLLRK